MILLLGSTGYVGQAFVASLEKSGADYVGVSRSAVDYSQRDGMAKLIRCYRPELVINCAGYTGKPNVDACEGDKGNCLAGNAALPGILRQVCEAEGVAWGHVSSGCIFSGERPGGGGWREDDAPNFSFRKPPCSFYSGTKALGEETLGWGEVSASGDWPKWEHESAATGYVWRLRIPFDEYDGPRNYLSKMQRYDRLLQARNSLSHRDDFVQACLESWQRRVPFGIYNVTNPGSVTTREVIDIIKAKGVSDRVFSFFDSEDDFMAKAAKTPRSNCVLDTSKLAGVGIEMRPVQEAIESSLENWKKEVPA